MKILATTPLLFALLLTAPASTASADVIAVPGGQPTLNAALWVARPGDVIVVSTSAPQYAAVVTKPVTILGDPVVNLQNGPSVMGECPTSNPLLLAGPGYGIFTLVNARLSDNGDCGRGPIPLQGKGFDELHLYGCTLVAPDRPFTGYVEGCPGLQTSIPFVLVQDCEIRGANPNSDGCYGGVGPAHPGILAPNSIVVALDSEIYGGHTWAGYCEYGTECPPSGIGTGGDGGDAVVCHTLYYAGGALVPGAGATYTVFPSYSGEGIACGTAPDGQAIVASEIHPLSLDLFGSGPIHAGSTWTLSWDTPGPLAALYVAFDSSVAPHQLSVGAAFLESPLFAGFYPAGGGVRSLPIPVPKSLLLYGTQVAFQMLDVTSGLTRPVCTLVR